MKITKMMRSPFTTFTLIGSLIGGANAANLVTWSITDANSATAMMTNGIVITPTATNGATFTALHTFSDAAWAGDFGNSFFPYETSGNSLDLSNPQNLGQVKFEFSASSPNTELWFSNTIVDLLASGPFTTLDSNESSQSGQLLVNGGTSDGPGDPVQSAGRILIIGTPQLFALRGQSGQAELLRVGIVDQIPEPSSTLLLGLCSLGLVLKRSRR